MNGDKPGNGKTIPFSEPALDFKVLSQNSVEADEISVNQESLRSFCIIPELPEVVVS